MFIARRADCGLRDALELFLSHREACHCEPVTIADYRPGPDALCPLGRQAFQLVTPVTNGPPAPEHGPIGRSAKAAGARQYL